MTDIVKRDGPRFIIEADHDVIAATIERCARIAEIAESNFPDTMRRDIAAAIRALKEKP